MMASQNPSPVTVTEMCPEKKNAQMLLFHTLHCVRAYFVRGIQVFLGSPLRGNLFNSIANRFRGMLFRSTVSRLVHLDVAPLRPFESYICSRTTVSQVEHINFAPLRRLASLYLSYAALEWPPPSTPNKVKIQCKVNTM